MIEHIRGLDLSLTAPGVADIARDGDTLTASTRVEGGNARENPTLAQRVAQLRYLRARCVPPRAWTDDDGAEHTTILAVVEAPLLGVNPAASGKSHERAGLYWLVVSLLLHREIPVALTHPGTLKKWATNNGHATKSQMRYAAGELWPGVFIRDDNAADALLAASAGAHRLEWPVLLDAWAGLRRQAQLANMTWPADMPAPAKESV